jgi:hypothetical protein
MVDTMALDSKILIIDIVMVNPPWLLTMLNIFLSTIRGKEWTAEGF